LAINAQIFCAAVSEISIAITTEPPAIGYTIHHQPSASARSTDIASYGGPAEAQSAKAGQATSH
jgi:hypothetical protein